MTTEHSLFWEDLARDLGDPEFLRAFVIESVRIATIGKVVNELDAAREAAGLSKAALARAIGSNPDAVRRLLTSGHVNPTLGTIAELAAAVGMRLTLEPLPTAERRHITEPLISGEHADPQSLAEHLSRLRRPHHKAPVAA